MNKRATLKSTITSHIRQTQHTCCSETCLLVDAQAQGCLGNVEHDAGAAVVVLEGHTLVDGRVALDVHVVSPLPVGSSKKNARGACGQALALHTTGVLENVANILPTAC